MDTSINWPDAIAYKGGNYNPDFLVETRDGKLFVIEVKARDELEPMSEDVQAKPQAAKAWCSVMSNETGKIWEYKMIPREMTATMWNEQ